MLWHTPSAALYSKWIIASIGYFRIPTSMIFNPESGILRRQSCFLDEQGFLIQSKEGHGLRPVKYSIQPEFACNNYDRSCKKHFFSSGLFFYNLMKNIKERKNKIFGIYFAIIIYIILFLPFFIHHDVLMPLF
jgi:hypothetical protein